MSGTSSYRQFVSRGRKNSNFMRQFRDSTTKELIKLTSQQFMDVWKHYDHDGKEKIDINISGRYLIIIWSLSDRYLLLTQSLVVISCVSLFLRARAL